MKNAFIIMQIGNAELDRVCQHAIVPALVACGFDPKRVDKHNQGGLLKSEIIGFIERSEVIVADLTNERPNCYLEIGYAMGIEKFRNLVLTVREDHGPDSPNHARGGPKVHFDLAGYDILFWHPDNLDAFRSVLEKKVRRRLAVLSPSSQAFSWDEEWIAAQRGSALQGLSAAKMKGFMEVRFALEAPKPNKTQKELDEAARMAESRRSGWPIGVYLGNRDEHRPRPRADGIVAEITADDKASYDYWAIRRNGDFYFLSSLIENMSDPTKIFVTTRIARATEAFLYCARLYSRLKIDPTAFVNVAVKHGGLKGRFIGMSSSGRDLTRAAIAEDETEVKLRTSLQEIESNLVSLVKQLVAPVFVLFEFYELDDAFYENIVNNLVNGRQA